MDNSVQKSLAYVSFKKANNILEKKLINILEYEICKEYKQINTKIIYQTIKSLDRLEDLDKIPEEFTLENFTKRFNTLHNMNLSTYNSNSK